MYLRDHTDLWGWYQNSEYEPHETELVKKIVKKDWMCLDVGANIGFYTILMSKLSDFVYAYEPEPTNYELLRENILLNNLKNVEFFDSAVGEQEGVKSLWLCDESHGMHRMFASKFC